MSPLHVPAHSFSLLNHNLLHLANSWSPFKNHLVGAQVPTELSWTPQGRPWRAFYTSTHSHRTLHPSVKLRILSSVIVFSRFSPRLIARSLRVGPFLVICMVPAHSPVCGVINTVKFMQVLERSARTRERDGSPKPHLVRTTGENAGVRRLGVERARGRTWKALF